MTVFCELLRGYVSARSVQPPRFSAVGCNGLLAGMLMLISSVDHETEITWGFCNKQTTDTGHFVLGSMALQAAAGEMHDQEQQGQADGVDSHDVHPTRSVDAGSHTNLRVGFGTGGQLS